MAFEQIQDFHRQFVAMHCDRMQRHQIRHQPIADARIFLKLPNEIAVGENAQQLLVVTRDHGRAAAEYSAPLLGFDAHDVAAYMAEAERVFQIAG